MRIDHADFAPGTLVDHGEGKYSLIYSAFPDFEDIFTRKRLQGGGHTWHGMVVHLLEELAPDSLEFIEFDPEASMLSAVSDNLDALREVAKVLRKLEDRDVVAQLVENVELTEYD